MTALKDIVIFPSEPARHYSRASRFGDLVFMAGLCARDPARGYETVGSTLEDQCAQIFGRIQDTLHEAGTDLANTVKVTVFLADIRTRDALVPILQRYFADPPPPITIVEAKLVGPRDLLEIDVTAAVVSDG
jgi:2-iminobutanoate/2-iminopropanoate deaminase